MAPPKQVISISSDEEGDDIQPTGPNTWVATMTKSKCSGRQTLCVPKHIRDSWFADEPDYMFVKNAAEPDEHKEWWDLKWHDDPRVCLIGHGWYEFCKFYNLKPRDQVSFTKHQDKYMFTVTIHRKG
ncbi:DNA-binding barrel domain superfamily [Sesbania bispinosa]|nr:DNA-binding barrel domain superfamily [Sesbania bispinosa]